MSGPILDRIDIQIEVPPLTSVELQDSAAGEPSAIVRQRVIAAREIQQRRGGLNAFLSNAAFKQWCALDASARRLVADAVDRAGMSARGLHRALRVARTIADLAGEGPVSAMWLAEALQYRTDEVGRFATLWMVGRAAEESPGH